MSYVQYVRNFTLRDLRNSYQSFFFGDNRVHNHVRGGTVCTSTCLVLVHVAMAMIHDVFVGWLLCVVVWLVGGESTRDRHHFFGCFFFSTYLTLF